MKISGNYITSQCSKRNTTANFGITPKTDYTKLKPIVTMTLAEYEALERRLPKKLYAKSDFSNLKRSESINSSKEDYTKRKPIVTMTLADYEYLSKALCLPIKPDKTEKQASTELRLLQTKFTHTDAPNQQINISA